jgi:exodeoxyribonuclease VII large subunit
VSPLATLERGYAIVTAPGGAVLRSAAALRPGDQVDVRLASGSFSAEVVDVTMDTEPRGTAP